MKNKAKKILLSGLFLSIAFSCTPDYVDNAPTAPNNPNVPEVPSNPSEQSITLNFTHGEFIGVENISGNFQNSYGGATKTTMDEDIIYLLVYGNGTNQFNANISNKENGQLRHNLDNESVGNNIITIKRGGKLYTSTSGTFTISNEQSISNQDGMEIIKCKFNFNGTFKASTLTSSEILETDVKINGTVIF